MVGMTLRHEGFRYFLPRALDNELPEGLGDYQLQGSPGPIVGQGDIEARVGGGLVFHFQPTIKVDVQVSFATKTVVDASIKLSTDASIRFDLAISTKCTNGLQADVEGHIGMDLDIEGALKRLQERASLSPIPDADTATCAVSVSRVYCADPDGDRDPGPDCDLRDLPDRKYPVTRRDLSWVDEEEDASQTPNDNNEVTPMINVLEKRTIKKLRYCDLPKTQDRWKKHERTYSGLLWFPDNPPSTALVARYPNVATYDAADFLDCKNFDLARISTPTNPFEKSLNGGRRYETEHILEGQALQQFFITYSRRWSDRKEADKYANPNARYFRSPKASDDGELTWCEYMKLWWDIQFPASTRVCLAYPGLTAKEHDDEYVLLVQRLKGQWYNRIASYHTGYIDDYFQARDWDNVARTIKMQILNWKYYSEYESNRVILAKQARRVTEKLEGLEGNGPESIQQTVTGYATRYEPQSLSVYWNSLCGTSTAELRKR